MAFQWDAISELPGGQEAVTQRRAAEPATSQALATSPTGSGSTSQSDEEEIATAIQNLERHPELALQLQNLLPAGLSLQDAAAGFTEYRQFIATLHLSHSLNISFHQLKAAVTGERPKTLGQASRELAKPANSV